MKTTTKLMLIVMLAFAAGGTCPSDVNNDGTVGINDFLQLLGDWGPCPTASVIAMEALQASVFQNIIRCWSDGRLEIVWENVQNAPGVWHVDEAPASSNTGQPVGVSVARGGDGDCSLGPSPTCAEQGFGNPVRYRIYRQYADGSAEYILMDFCNDAGADNFCRSLDTAWIPIPGLKP